MESVMHRLFELKDSLIEANKKIDELVENDEALLKLIKDAKKEKRFEKICSDIETHVPEYKKQKEINIERIEIIDELKSRFENPEQKEVIDELVSKICFALIGTR